MSDADALERLALSDALSVAFPREALKSRSGGGGKQLTYVEGHTVIHRLIDATANNWNFSVDKIERTEIDAQNAVLMAYVTLEIPGLGRRSHIGVQAVNARGGEDLVKGAVTDALKKAATLFGVGLELYGPDYEAGETGNAPVAAQNGLTATFPARDRSTSRNTVDDGDEPYPDGGGLTNRQMRAIVAIGRKINLDPAESRQMHGKESAAELTEAEADEFIARLRQQEKAMQQPALVNADRAERYR